MQKSVEPTYKHKEAELDDCEEPLLLACLSGEFSECEALISQGTPINRGSIHGQTALMMAAQNGHLNVVQLLLENGADVSQTDIWGYNALMKSAAGGHTAVFQVLAIKCHSLSLDTFLGRQTALTEAAAFGRNEIVELCLARDRTLLNACVGLTGMTPLMLAVVGGHYNTVEILLTNGADLLMRNTSLHSARDLALELELEAVLELFDSRLPTTPTRVPRIPYLSVDKCEDMYEIPEGKLPLTPNARLPVKHSDNQQRIDSIVQQVTRRSKSADRTKRRRSATGRSDGIFHYILETAGLEKIVHVFKEQEVDLKIFFTLTTDDFFTIGISDEETVVKLMEISHHYKSIFNL